MLAQWLAKKGHDLKEISESPGVHFSYSQFGEDLILSHLMNFDHGFYVDIGCFDPFKYSNTCLLHRFRGWKGINIDADSGAVRKFMSSRPNDINLNFGVGAAESELEFTTFDDGARNTFDSSMVDRALKAVKVKERTTVKVRRLESILDEHIPANQMIDYLNVDCEGLDQQVLLGNNWEHYAPRFISIEIHDLDLSQPRKNAVVSYLIEKGYRFKAQYFVTSIFQHTG